MKKEEKRKVGRPKLADSKLKIESLIVISIVGVLVIAIGFFAFKILTIDFNPKYTVATAYNDHVQSCVIENTKIDCGPKVSYMKYKIGNEDFKEITKEDKSIEVKIENKNRRIEVCYKTDSPALKCIKK